MPHDLCCRSCASRYVHGAGFFAVEIHLMRTISSRDLMRVKNLMVSSEAFFFCPNCNEQFVRPAAEVPLARGYRWRVATMVLFGIAPITGLVILLGALVMVGGLPSWLLTFGMGLIVAPAIVAAQWIRQRMSARDFSERIRLSEKLGLGPEFEIIRVKTEPAP